MFVLPTFGLGVIASPTVPPGTFDTATLVNGNNVKGAENTITFTVQPSRDIDAGDSITLAGLTGSQIQCNHTRHRSEHLSKHTIQSKRRS